LDSAHLIEDESNIFVTDTFCVLTKVIKETAYVYTTSNLNQEAKAD